MKKLIFTAFALVAFSGFSMANTVFENKKEKLTVSDIDKLFFYHINYSVLLTRCCTQYASTTYDGATITGVGYECASAATENEAMAQACMCANDEAKTNLAKKMKSLSIN